MSANSISRNPYIYILGTAFLYGVVCQFAIRSDRFQGLFDVMSFAMIFGFPFCAGALTVGLATFEQQRSWYFRLFGPLPPTILGILFSILVGWEGSICAAFAMVVFLPSTSLGGILSGIFFSWRKPRGLLHCSILALLALVPPGGAHVESLFPPPERLGRVHTSIDISASAEGVWEKIASVSRITEPLNGFFYSIGFPKPIEATISKHGLGGVRLASFEGGLIFTETVTEWRPPAALGFEIEVDPTSVPTTTLDPHVVVSGRYFDVLSGRYEIEVLSESLVRLHLTSTTRVSTRFNFYAGPLSDWLMHDIQTTILGVIKARSEGRIQKTGDHP